MHVVNEFVDTGIDGRERVAQFHKLGFWRGDFQAHPVHGKGSISLVCGGDEAAAEVRSGGVRRVFRGVGDGIVGGPAVDQALGFEDGR